MILIKAAFLISFLAIISNALGQSQKTKTSRIKNEGSTSTDSTQKVNWLKKNAIPIKSIDPLDDDFSDLMPLIKIIGDVQVVMIGEPNHHIGTVYSAKTRLVKFLHQEMGFNLLTFESGMYDVAKAWQEIKAEKNENKVFNNAVFFGNYEEYKPLISYLKRTSNAKKPLEIAGFDSQMNGSYSKDSLFSELRRFFRSINYLSPTLDDSSFFARELTKANSFYKRANAPDKTVIDTLNLLLKRIDSLASKPHIYETSFYIQTLKSLKRETQNKLLFGTILSLSGADRQRLFNLYSSIRDEQMAENLLWYLKQNPKQKIIVWAHNVHVMTDYPGDMTKEMWNEKPDAPPAAKANWENTYMGYIIKDSLKNKVFSIAITGNSGELGRINHRDSTRNFRFPIKKSTRAGVLENYLDAAGFQQAFVNFKNPPKGGEWLKEKTIIRHSASNGDEYYWHKAIDALFYVREFTLANIKD